MKLFVLILLMLFVAVWTPVEVLADSLPVDPGNFTGTRTSPPANGVMSFDSWTAAEGGFRISWNISFSGGLWHYTYTLTNLDGTLLDKELSHWILEVSANFTAANIFNSSHAFELKTYSGADPSNPNLPGSIYGLKFEGTGPTFSFDSDRAPMWGDFYAIDGKNTDPPPSAYNTGFGTDPTAGTTNFTPWIAVPNTTTTAIPEPTSVLLVGTGLSFLLLWSRRRSKK
jgi:hypothetical protein